MVVTHPNNILGGDFDFIKRSFKSKIEDLKAEKNEEKDDCENGLKSPTSHLPSQKLERVKPSPPRKHQRMAYLPEVLLTKRG
ncbi:hypothetical protein MTR_2g451410 [Medicago truncatula]|uniref:Uncharacterized protein n=1 Tax=Medicago truncatula TaxID=3880 RepID=A0A072VIG1_MEDTR|nr:hypothetical protein MTR_2g451410 [Medicago truncatula]